MYEMAMRTLPLILLVMTVLSLRSGANQASSESSESAENVEQDPPAGRQVASWDAFRADIVCQARCMAKCLADNTTVSGTNRGCGVACSSYNSTWLNETCTTASCQETCDNLARTSDSQLKKPILHEVAILNNRVAVMWEFDNCSACEGPDIVNVVRYSGGFGEWKYGISMGENKTFYLDLQGVCAKYFQIVSVNQFGLSPASDMKMLRPYRAVKEGTFRVVGVELLSSEVVLKVSLTWQNASGDVPAMNFSLETLSVVCHVQSKNSTATTFKRELPDVLPVVNWSVKESAEAARGRCFVSYQLLGSFGACYDTEPVSVNYTYHCKEFPVLEDNCALPRTPVVDSLTVRVTRHGDIMRVEWDEVESTSEQTVYGYKVQVGEYEAASQTLLFAELKDGTTTIYDVAGKENNMLNLTGLQAGVHYGVKVLANLGKNGTKFDMMPIKDFTMEAFDYGSLMSTSTPSGMVVSPPFAVAGGVIVAIIILVVVTTVVALVVVALVVQKCCRKTKPGLAKRSLRRDTESMSNMYSSTPAGDRNDGQGSSPEPPIPDRWEVAYDRLEMGQVLGKGQFGIVMKAFISGKLSTHTSGSSLFRDSIKREDIEVAVKMLHDFADDIQRQEFRSEMKLMKDIGRHSNLVSLLGCCSSEATPLCLIVEHCCHGDLLHFLRANRGVMMRAEKDVRSEGVDTDLLTANDLLSFASQIARGMEYLSQKGFVHRDLAARNVMVAENKTVKIGDFGLTRYVFDDSIYVHRRGGKLPIKWMSVEALYDQVFTRFNDVWSFGVLLFELVTLGASPYPGIHNKDIPVMLKRGDRMQRPENCSEVLYAIMIACWHPSPDDRPTFTHLRNKLEALLEEDTPYLEFNQDYSYFPFLDISEESEDLDSEEREDVGGLGKESVTRSDDIAMVCMGESDEDKPASTLSSDDVFVEQESSSQALLLSGCSPHSQDGDKVDGGNLQKRDSGLGSDDMYSSRRTNMEDVPLM